MGGSADPGGRLVSVTTTDGHDGPQVALIEGDAIDVFRTIDDQSVDLILTDPPYLAEYISLYGDLAREAARILKPDSFLICYVGHYHLVDVMQMMSPHMEYFWLIAQINAGQKTMVRARRQICAYKPILVWRVGSALPRYPVMDTLSGGRRTKQYHPWEQNVGEARHLIRYYSEPGDLVLDPFLGSGTTGVAAIQTGRRFAGIEIDPDTLTVARTRIARTVWQSHDRPTIQTPLIPDIEV